MLLKAVLPLLAMAVQLAFGHWAETHYLIVRNITTGLVPNYIEKSTVYPTASVSATSTSTSVRTDYFRATQNGYGRAVVNVTTSYIMLPTDKTDLPILTAEPTPTASPSITTNYYVPVTVSNPESCTLTDFTYTDTIGVQVPSLLASRATMSDLALFVTTYESTLSTNMGGQPVTTSVCDVYLKSGAVPVVDGDIAIDNENLLTECVDPRAHVCTEPGQNSAATGSGGCVGPYPPTAVNHQASTTGDQSGAGPAETGGAGSLRSQMGCLMFSSVFIAVALLMN